MKKIIQISLLLLVTIKAHAIESTNAWGSNSDWANALGLTPAGLTNLIASLNSLPDLAEQFNWMWSTNESTVSDFDKQICDSLHIRTEAPIMITFKGVSLVFHFPNKLVVAGSSAFDSKAEMDRFPNLVYENGKISRTNTDEQVPATYIELFDPAVKEPTVEASLLLGLAPVAKPDDVRYFHRSFWFVHRKIWEKEGHPPASE